MGIQGDDGTVDGKRVGQNGVVHPVTLADNQRNRKRLAAVLALSALGFLPPWVAAASVAAPGENIGTWILNCESGICTARHKEHLFEKVGVTAAFELRLNENVVVPTVVLRGLPDQPGLMGAVSSAMAEGVKASVQIGSVPPAELTCLPDGGTFVCLPNGNPAQALAAALPDAKSLTFRVAARPLGRDGDLSRSRSIQLSGTRVLLARVGIMGRMAPAPRPERPTGWAELLDQALKAAGYRGGQAGLQALVAPYLKR